MLQESRRCATLHAMRTISSSAIATGQTSTLHHTVAAQRSSARATRSCMRWQIRRGGLMLTRAKQACMPVLLPAALPVLLLGEALLV